ncbi:MAG: hypothetical protein ACYDAZ_08930 [Thermoplasmataceae archaeon]
MKRGFEIMFAWFAALTVLGWTGDLAMHWPGALAWVHATWRVIGFENARGIGPWTVLFAIAKSLPAGFFLIPLAGGAIVFAVAWFAGPGAGDNGGVQRGSTVTDARTLARIIKRRK